jgi:hypothetical protein
MPVMDGLTATRAIRSGSSEPPATHPDHRADSLRLKGDQEKCMAAGCTAYLSKPIKQEVLLQAIREHSVAVPRSPRIVVRVNPKYADMVPGFLRNRRQDVITMLDALDRGDFETVESIGHGMKGAGAATDSRPSPTSERPSSRRRGAPTPARRAGGCVN